jgi:thiol-disulfide isomerase/thioredoxin
MLVAGMLLFGLAAAMPHPFSLKTDAAFAAGLENTPAPDFELKDVVSGSNVKLSSFKGQKPVLVYFWATWCPSCLKAKPNVIELRKKVPESDLSILGIDVGGADSLERVKRFQEANPVAWPILFDKDGSVSRTYRVQGIPLFVLVNKAGNITYMGYTPPDSKTCLQ